MLAAVSKPLVYHFLLAKVSRNWANYLSINLFGSNFDVFEKRMQEIAPRALSDPENLLGFNFYRSIITEIGRTWHHEF